MARPPQECRLDFSPLSVNFPVQLCAASPGVATSNTHDPLQVLRTPRSRSTGRVNAEFCVLSSEDSPSPYDLAFLDFLASADRSAQVTIIITLFPVLRAVAVHTLNTAVMQIATSNITLASNTSFTLTLEGQVKKVGIFPAQLHFAKPVVVYWIAPENLTEELALGQFGMLPRPLTLPTRTDDMRYDQLSLPSVSPPVTVESSKRLFSTSPTNRHSHDLPSSSLLKKPSLGDSRVRRSRRRLSRSSRSTISSSPRFVFPLFSISRYIDWMRSLTLSRRS